MSRISATVPSPRMVAPEKDLDVGVQLGERLDDGLVVADDLVDDQADACLAGRDDDHLLVAVGLAVAV